MANKRMFGGPSPSLSSGKWTNSEMLVDLPFNQLMQLLAQEHFIISQQCTTDSQISTHVIGQKACYKNHHISNSMFTILLQITD
jgi:hypothetical protein